MKLLSIIAITFIVSLVATQLIEEVWGFLFFGNLAMAAFMVFMGLEKGMSRFE